MVVRLRLQRFGRKGLPFYHIVAADSKAPRNGKKLMTVGSFNPIADSKYPKELRLEEDKVKYWLSVGAQPTDRVAHLLHVYGIIPKPPSSFKWSWVFPKSEVRANKGPMSPVAICEKLGL